MVELYLRRGEIAQAQRDMERALLEHVRRAQRRARRFRLLLRRDVARMVKREKVEEGVALERVLRLRASRGGYRDLGRKALRRWRLEMLKEKRRALRGARKVNGGR